MSKKKMLCILFAFILISMLTMAISGRSKFPLVNSIVAGVVLPAEYALNTVWHGIDGVREYWKALTVTQRENEQLNKENEELRRANINMASLYAENQQLRKLLDYKEAHASQKLVAARVISRDHGNLRDHLYIDAGRDKGVEEEMAVVKDGFVGIIDGVYEDYSRVLLITSVRCRIGARVLRSDSRAIGIAGGHRSLDRKLLLEHIYREASIREGDVIVSSGFSGKHPEDIVIGTVTAVRDESSGLLQEADVAPAADIAGVEHVFVITGFTPVPKNITDAKGGLAK
ncbi:MAG: rod shape-determining protein MreC [Acidaminococcaceae bacterium]|nr:rod shape-determining protein MreC [Acidaminococcaceae bacterium]